MINLTGTGAKIVYASTIVAALVTFVTARDSLEPVFPATREYARELVQRVVDSNAQQLQGINRSLLQQSLDAATRELVDYSIKAKTDPDPLIAQRIRQLEDDIQAMKQELQGLQ
jgi:Na+/phosphate symporter